MRKICGYGGIGRRARFRIWCLRRAGSSPVIRTDQISRTFENGVFGIFLFLFLKNVDKGEHVLCDLWKNRKRYVMIEIVKTAEGIVKK